MKKNFIILLAAVIGFFSINSYGQLRPAQSQYLEDFGLFMNPKFEQGYKGWTVSGCTKSLENDIPYQNKTLKLSCSAETFSVKQEITSVTHLSTSGKELVLKCRIKPTASGVKVRTLANGVEENLRNIGSGKYTIVEIPVGIDSTSNGGEVFADSAYTGDVFIDDCALDVAPVDYVNPYGKQFEVAYSDGQKQAY